VVLMGTPQQPPRPRPRSCAQAGACQALPDCDACGYPVGECQDVAGNGVVCTRLHRATPIAPPRPSVHVKVGKPTRADWLWHLAIPLALYVVLLLAHVVANLLAKA
jgi:hypothetical protein